MDFDDTHEEAAFRAEARQWLSANAIPKGSPEDFSAGNFSGQIEPAEYVKRCRWWQGQLFDGGWAGITWPKEVGGRGGLPIEEAVFAEEQSKYGVSAGVFMVAHGMVAPTLMQHATADQQARYLGPMLRGDELWCQLFSEPDAGSDLASLTTRTVRDGDEYVVTGQKVWTSYAHVSEWGILIARTNPDAPRHAGITYFIVDMTTPGIDVRPLRQMNGEAHFNEVFLHEVRIPAANVIGEVDGGWKVAVTTLSNERASIAGGSGISDPDRLIALARDLGATADPIFRQRFVEVWSRNEILRYLRLRSRTALSKGVRPGAEGSVMKLAYARYVKQLGALAIGVQGPYGQLSHPDALLDGVFQQKFINAVQSSIGGGTDEIQHNIVGERVLGLPASLGSDRVVQTALNKGQAARRGRVLEAALTLGADGGYDAVQMRDVATEAGVALGTIYRYFSSKDHLLAEALVEWAADLGRKVSRRPPSGDTVSARVVDVLRRATRSMEQEPRLSEAVITALTSTDSHAARCQREVGLVMNEIIASAFPSDFDAATRDDIVRVLGHVWFSSLIGWVNRWYGINHVGDEVEIAAHLLLDQYG